MKTPPTWEEELKNKVFRFVPVTPGDKILIQTFVQSLLTSHEATIRQEIGEEVEGVFFEGTTGNASYDTAIKELWGKVFKPKVLAIINQTTKI